MLIAEIHVNAKRTFVAVHELVIICQLRTFASSVGNSPSTVTKAVDEALQSIVGHVAVTAAAPASESNQKTPVQIHSNQIRLGRAFVRKMSTHNVGKMKTMPNTPRQIKKSSTCTLLPGAWDKVRFQAATLQITALQMMKRTKTK